MEAVEGRNVSITAGTKFDLPLLVKAPSHVDWSFTFSRESAGTDINFGVQLKGAPSAHGPSDVEVVAPTRLADPEDGAPQKGSFDVDAGMCQFTWDNTHSWWTAKTVSYKIKIRANDAADGAAGEATAAPEAAAVGAAGAGAGDDSAPAEEGAAAAGAQAAAAAAAPAAPAAAPAAPAAAPAAPAAPAPRTKRN